MTAEALTMISGYGQGSAGLTLKLALPFLLLLSAPTAIAGRRPGYQRKNRRYISELRAHIRHVFVIYQENRSFDSYFGTFPGADNLATAEARQHGFREYDPIGHIWVTPFRLDAADVASPNHSRVGLIAKSDGGRMDRFVAEEEQIALKKGASRSYSRQMGLVTMAYEDCDTIPFLWLYAHRFALYDHIFEGMYGPSTPGNIDLIAAQTGQTQWARNPGEAVRTNDTGPGEPVATSMDPPFGPYAHGVPRAHQLDQNYATLLLTLLGRKAAAAKLDNGGVRQDITELAKLDHQAVPWAWYQEGFGNGHGNFHPAYIPHHNAPQYFGYIRENQPLWSGVHDLTDFFTVMAEHQLAARSVVFIKGGHHNPFGWRPANSDPRVQALFLGDDDHPANSDSQIAESLVAKVVNTVARSPYWSDSAIFIIWDDPGGFYDHVAPPQFEVCPDGHPCGDGPRIPLILISPYAKGGAIVHEKGDHASFAKFIDAVFGLPALASLPDEKPYMPEGPRDANPRLTNLLGGFDPARLGGSKPPIPASEAEIPDAAVNRFPPPVSCKTIGVTPVSVPGALSTPPAGFNPLPRKWPGYKNSGAGGHAAVP
jgi:phospholipase C